MDSEVGTIFASGIDERTGRARRAGGGVWRYSRELFALC